jgi:hypothetical protein
MVGCRSLVIVLVLENCLAQRLLSRPDSTCRPLRIAPPRIPQPVEDEDDDEDDYDPGSEHLFSS